MRQIKKVVDGEVGCIVHRTDGTEQCHSALFTVGVGGGIQNHTVNRKRTWIGGFNICRRLMYCSNTVFVNMKYNIALVVAVQLVCG